LEQEEGKNLAKAVLLNERMSYYLMRITAALRSLGSGGIKLR